MRVINLDSWAGLTFYYAPGEIIDLPDNIATARLALGLCLPVEDPKPIAEKAQKKGVTKC